MCSHKAGASQQVGRTLPPSDKRHWYIQQALAHYSSRRTVEAWLRAGRIVVNGQLARPGQKLHGGEAISLDGRSVYPALPATQRVLALYKPEGVICTRRDPQGRPTAYERLPADRSNRWINIGRLDINSTGLLLFSNDGRLVQRLCHPGMQVEREYAVRVFGQVTATMRRNMLRGIRLDGRLSRFTDMVPAQHSKKGVNQWYYVVLMTGAHREVRRIFASQGCRVARLIRVRYGTYALPRDKRPGDRWELSKQELERLDKQ